MKWSTIRPDELGPAELGAWRRFQDHDSSLANPFLSPGFTLAVGRIRAGARVSILEDAGELVGFFPHERGRLGIGRPIGAGVSDCQALIHAPGVEWDASALLRESGLAVWEFSHLLARQAPFAAYHLAHEPSPVIRLENGYQSYLDALRRRSNPTVKKTFYKGRKMGREAGELRFVFDDRDEAALKTLMLWKSAQYRRTGRSDRFAKAWIAQVVSTLFKERGDGCVGTLSTMFAGDRLVAAHFGLRSSVVLSRWFPAYDPEFAKYSPGMLFNLHLAEAVAAEGIGLLDLGKGQSWEKDFLRNGEIAVAEGRIERPCGAALARRAQQAPRRCVMNYVLSRPDLRRKARATLNRIGRLRSAAARRD